MGLSRLQYFTVVQDLFCRLKTLCAYDHLLQPPTGLNNVDANWIEEEETTQVGKQEIDCKVQINLGLF